MGSSSTKYLMVVSIGVLVALHLSSPDAEGGQSSGTAPDRTMPGFGLLDSSIPSIEHVDPIHSTTLTLFTALRNESLTPRDMGVEFHPWLLMGGRPSDTIAKTYQSRYRPGVLGAMRQFVGISMAVSQNVGGTGVGDARSHMALGVRTFVNSGRPNGALDRLLRGYDSQVDALEQAISEQAGADDPEQAEQRAAALLVSSRAVLAQLSTVDKSRVGFLLELGAGYVLTIPNNALGEATEARRGFWLTPMYRFDTVPLTFAGTLRFQRDADRDIKSVSGGARATVRRQGVGYSLEWVERFRRAAVRFPDDDFVNTRLIGSVSYGFSRSTLLDFTLGKNYRDNLSRGGSMVASFSLTLGLAPIDFGVPGP